MSDELESDPSDAFSQALLRAYHVEDDPEFYRQLRRRQPAPDKPRRATWFVGVASVATAVAVVIVLNLPMPDASSEFSARGADSGSLRQDVGIEVYRYEGRRAVLLRRGDHIKPNAALSIRLINRSSHRCSFRVSILDAAGERYPWVPEKLDGEPVLVEGQSSTEHREHGLKLRDFRSGPTAVKIRVERSPPDREADRESDNKVDIEFLLSVT
ncbi:MAG: hypothetical protein AAFQ65_09140 [Myxococcota bacterium]